MVLTTINNNCNYLKYFKSIQYVCAFCVNIHHNIISTLDTCLFLFVQPHDCRNKINSIIKKECDWLFSWTFTLKSLANASLQAVIVITSVLLPPSLLAAHGSNVSVDGRLCYIERDSRWSRWPHPCLSESVFVSVLYAAYCVQPLPPRTCISLLFRRIAAIAHSEKVD